MNRHDSKEIEKIAEYLDGSEKVLLVAIQARWLPGGSPITPNTIFATNQKIIIRNPMFLGLREHIDYYYYKDIINIKCIKGYFTSSLHITAPGMATSARTGDNEDGVIRAINKDIAVQIQQLAKK